MNPIGRDLKLLRTQKKLSLEEVYQLTKIPLHRLDGIENGSIFKDLVKEPTVLRSFIRGYGKALGIPDQTIVEALDLEKSGRYSQELIEWVEKNKSWKVQAASETGNSSTGSPTAPKKRTIRKKVLSDEDSDTESIQEPVKQKSSAAPEKSQNKSHTQSLFDQPPLASSRFTLIQNPVLPNVAPDAPSVENIDWASKRISNIRIGHPRLIFFIVVTILSLMILGALIWGVSRLFTGDSSAESTDQTEQTSDNARSGSSTEGTSTIEEGSIVTLPVQSLGGSNAVRSSTAGSTTGSATGSETANPSGTTANPQAGNRPDSSPTTGNAGETSISANQSSGLRGSEPTSQMNNSSSDESNASSPETAETASSGQLRTQPPFEVLIYAHSGALSALQFSIDENTTRRNVRLAQGEAFRVQPNQEIRFEGAFSSMIVFVNGEPIDNFQELFYDRRQRQVILNRDLLDGLSNDDPRDLRLPRGVNPPSSIREVP